MIYRRAEKQDIRSFTEHRVEFVTSIRTIEDVGGFREATEKYIAAHINGGSLIIYIAEEEGRILASCMLCVYFTAPGPSCLSGKIGELLNVYTLRGYRRRGIAIDLIRLLLNDAREAGVDKIVLDYTEDGYLVYKKLGFQPEERCMSLRLR